ncbi:MAG: hypothetical protein U0V03_05800 [Bacteroidia bacterium]
MIKSNFLFITTIQMEIIVSLLGCKKDKKLLDSSEESPYLGNSILASRMISGLGNIKYKSNFQMLEFESIDQYKATLAKIQNDANQYAFDNGNPKCY